MSPIGSCVWILGPKLLTEKTVAPLKGPCWRKQVTGMNLEPSSPAHCLSVILPRYRYTVSTQPPATTQDCVPLELWAKQTLPTIKLLLLGFYHSREKVTTTLKSGSSRSALSWSYLFPRFQEGSWHHFLSPWSISGNINPVLFLKHTTTQASWTCPQTPSCQASSSGWTWKWPALTSRSKELRPHLTLTPTPRPALNWDFPPATGWCRRKTSSQSAVLDVTVRGEICWWCQCADCP